MTEKTGTRITQVRTVAVPVADLDRALAFYSGTLGFEVRLDAMFGPGQRWIEVAPVGAVTTIAFSLTEAAHPGVDTGIRFATTDAAVDHAGLTAQGVDVDPEILRWPGVPAMFVLRDPDGNRLTVVEET